VAGAQTSIGASVQIALGGNALLRARARGLPPKPPLASPCLDPQPTHLHCGRRSARARRRGQRSRARRRSAARASRPPSLLRAQLAPRALAHHRPGRRRGRRPVARSGGRSDGAGPRMAGCATIRILVQFMYATSRQVSSRFVQLAAHGDEPIHDCCAYMYSNPGQGPRALLN
jgi:hypothetical protein